MEVNIKSVKKNEKSSFGMGFFVDVPQTLNIVVGIDLRGRQAAVPKQLFYGIQFSTISSEVGGKTVAQHVRTFLLCGGHQ